MHVMSYVSHPGRPQTTHVMRTGTGGSLLTAPIEISTLQGGRDHQQDAATWARVTDQDGKPFLLAAVADGSGAGSDVIARDAVRVAVDVASAYGPRDLDKAVNATREVLLGRHADRGKNDNCTLVLASVQFGTVRVAWTGDSRAYVLTGQGRLRLLTEDHNLARYGKPHVLTRSLLGPYGHDHAGHFDDCTEHQPGAAECGGAFRESPMMVVLCTDGVHGPLSDARIHLVLSGAPNAARAAKRLTGQAVRAVAEGESADNATALVIDLWAAA